MPATPMTSAPVVLDGTRVRMEPLDLARHGDGLLAIGLDEDLWRWTISCPRTPEALRAYLDVALAEQADGRSLPFATVDKVTGRVAGCTRFGNIDRPNRKVEIGWTWVGRPWQRTHVNTEAKYLMFTHAFETWGVRRLELKTDVRNERSRDAMKRIGCVEEGVLRSHLLREDGRWRDTIYYSVLDDEWPAVKARLEELMER